MLQCANSGDRGRSFIALLVLPAVGSRAGTPPFDSAIDVQLFDYSIGPKQFFTVDSADIADKKQLALDAVVTFMTKPFTVYNTDGDERPDDRWATRARRSSKSITAAQLTAAYGVNDKLQIGVNLPLVFSLTGDGLDPSTGTRAMNGVQVTGLGDLLVEGKYKLWTTRTALRARRHRRPDAAVELRQRRLAVHRRRPADAARSASP